MAAKSDKSATTDGASSTLKSTVRKATSSRRKAPAITEEMIAERAYLISQSDECLSDLENWLRAESELLNK